MSNITDLLALSSYLVPQPQVLNTYYEKIVGLEAITTSNYCIIYQGYDPTTTIALSLNEQWYFKYVDGPPNNGCLYPLPTGNLYSTQILDAKELIERIIRLVGQVKPIDQ